MALDPIPLLLYLLLLLLAWWLSLFNGPSMPSLIFGWSDFIDFRFSLLEVKYFNYTYRGKWTMPAAGTTTAASAAET